MLSKWNGGTKGRTYKVVLILSKGVTARRLSVTPAPKPAITVRGPEIFPLESSSIDLYWSKATNPVVEMEELAFGRWVNVILFEMFSDNLREGLKRIRNSISSFSQPFSNNIPDHLRVLIFAQSARRL